ncbi:hypothetical protein EON77_19075, partial [bacterium]
SIPSASAISAEKYYGTKPADAKSGLDMKAFLNLLSVQMANQNPLEPMNDRDYFAQLAQLGQVQGIDKLSAQSELQQIQGLMGKEVTAVRSLTETTSGLSDTVKGIATKVSIRNGERYISVREANGGEAEVKLANVQTVRERQRASDYSALVGKAVQGAGAEGAVVKGKVTGISETDSGVVLTLEGGAKLAADNISSIEG